MAARLRRRTRPIEVLVNESLAGTLLIESEDLSPLEHVAFTYTDSWLSSPDSFAVSPELPLIRGEQRPILGREMFGAFLDAAPDAWGERLLYEEARLQALAAKTALPRMTAATKLLMVNDQTRQGALRFRENGLFLSDWGGRADLRDLPELAAAAQVFAETGVIDERDRLLIGAGSSPGGAQPKAWIRDEDNSMLLAKFPKKSDIGNVQLWEMVAIRLQHRAGIRVQPSRLVPLNEHSQIFLTKRFDREGDVRIPYMSARTALQLDTFQRPDYVTLTREISMISASPTEDAIEMFSRAAFGAMVNNIDDHMRNHGLLRARNGWRLSPSFDVNPARSGSSETPLVPGGDPYDRNVLELLDHLDSFRLTRAAAVELLAMVDEAVSHWAEEAVALGAEADLPASMRAAFEGPNRERVQGLSDVSPSIIDLAKRATPAASTDPAGGDGELWVKAHYRAGRLIPGHHRTKPKSP